MDEGDVENTLAMVNLDSLAAGDITYVYSEEGEDAFLRDWVLEWADENGFPLRPSAMQTYPMATLLFRLWRLQGQGHPVHLL